VTDHCRMSTVGKWTPQGHRERVRPKNARNRDLEKDTWTAGFKHSCMEEGGGGSTGHSWMERTGLWPAFHREQQGISQSKSRLCRMLQMPCSRVKKPAFFKKTNPVGFIGFVGFTGFFGQAGKNR